LSHYIKEDLEVFRYILKKLAKRLESASEGIDPRESYFILDEWGDSVSASSPRICQLIDKFIKSEYALKIIEKYGFEPTNKIFKEETHGYCDIMTYIELAEDLINRGKVSNEDLGELFLADQQKKKASLDKEPKDEPRFKSFEYYPEGLFKMYDYLRR
jgi:hypothetical protein